MSPNEKGSIVSMLDVWLSQLSSVLHFPESYVILDKVLVPYICYSQMIGYAPTTMHMLGACPLCIICQNACLGKRC